VSEPILPPATLGILGGGQLGRMIGVAARQLGYGVRVYSPPGDLPAAAVGELHLGEWHDADAVAAFARRCAVVTYEFENVPAATVALVEAHAPVRPGGGLLAWTQDRLAEHELLESLGIPSAVGCAVRSRAELGAAVARFGLPGRIKSARGGYDGQGQQRLRSAEEVGAAVLDGSYRFERDVVFDREVSVVLARNRETAVFPVFENEHRDGILVLSQVPARVSERAARRCVEVAVALAERVDLRGTLTVECFVRGDEVLVNELAPRVHNSGHLTIEATNVSQFEQHVRAVCGLSLAPPTLRSPAAMANLLGTGEARPANPLGLDSVLAVPEAHLHLYGKREVRAGRKLGHVTVLAPTRELAVERALRSGAAIRWG
jgi:5-(carboxyamino)imidazole ribonucleotide synthase